MNEKTCCSTGPGVVGCTGCDTYRMARGAIAVPVRGLNAAIYDAQAKTEAETSVAKYGNATGQVVGLDAFLPALRTFTKSEVLTILRALKADTGVVAGKEALERAIRVFENMEGTR